MLCSHVRVQAIIFHLLLSLLMIFKCIFVYICVDDLKPSTVCFVLAIAVLLTGSIIVKNW